MKTKRWLAGSIGLWLVLLAVWRITAAAQGLTVTPGRYGAPPYTVIAPEGAAAKPRPVVLIGHGFAGSSVVMRGFAFTLAHAGYPTVLWDFDGHGANPQPLPMDSRGNALLENAEAALARRPSASSRQTRLPSWATPWAAASPSTTVKHTRKRAQPSPSHRWTAT